MVGAVSGFELGTIWVATLIAEYSGQDDRSFRLNVTDYSGLR